MVAISRLMVADSYQISLVRVSPGLDRCSRIRLPGWRRAGRWVGAIARHWLVKGADRWFRLSSFLFGAGVLCRAVAAVEVRGVGFSFFRLRQKPAPNPARSKKDRWQDWVGDDACLLAWLLACPPCCVITLVWCRARGLKRTKKSPKGERSRTVLGRRC